MFWGASIIQFGSLFTLFLLWVINRNPVAMYHAKAMFDRRNAALAESQRGRPQPDAPGSLPQDPDFPQASAAKMDVVGARLDSSDRVLFEGFVMLTLGVLLNYVGRGNQIAGDAFSLLILFSVFLVTCFHWSGSAYIAHGLWLITQISIVGLFLTPWCTTATNPI